MEKKKTRVKLQPTVMPNITVNKSRLEDLGINLDPHICRPLEEGYLKDLYNMLNDDNIQPSVLKMLR